MPPLVSYFGIINAAQHIPTLIGNWPWFGIDTGVKAFERFVAFGQPTLLSQFEKLMARQLVGRRLN
jgi:hypothetical protein